MSGTALGLALGAAALHALWNLLLAGAADTRAATAAALAVGVLVLAPVAALTGTVHSGVWPYVAVSAALETVYFLLLTAAYGRGALSAVYPVARGSAPVLVLGAGLAGVGGAVSAPQVAGVLLVGAGLLAVAGPARPGRRGTTDEPPGPMRRPSTAEAPPGALVLALATGAAIASYTLVDRAGLRHADALPYLWLVLAPSTVVAVAVACRERGPAAVRAQLGARTVVAGLATVGAYGLVLLALRHAPAAPVAAVRETSIVLAVALGALVLGEPVGPLRWVGSAAVTAGAALVALG